MRKWNLKHHSQAFSTIIRKNVLLDEKSNPMGSFEIELNAEKAQIRLNEKNYSVFYAQQNDNIELNLNGFYFRFRIQSNIVDSAAGSGALELRAQIPGKIIKILKNVGDNALSGETVLIQEAMKMEMPLKAEASGKIEAIMVREGDQVNSEQLLVKFAIDSDN